MATRVPVPGLSCFTSCLSCLSYISDSVSGFHDERTCGHRPSRLLHRPQIWVLSWVLPWVLSKHLETEVQVRPVSPNHSLSFVPPRPMLSTLPPRPLVIMASNWIYSARPPPRIKRSEFRIAARNSQRRDVRRRYAVWFSSCDSSWSNSLTSERPDECTCRRSSNSVIFKPIILAESFAVPKSPRRVFECRKSCCCNGRCL